MKHLTNLLLFLMTLSTPVSANDEELFKGKSYGSFMFFEEVPNALFFEDEITKNDNFEFRKAIRNHDIDTIVLSSPGGALFEGLTIAGMIFDKELTTYVPKTGRCGSACAFMFFAGQKRQATGELGVHQFYSSSDDESAKIANIEYGSQYTVSEIIGYLNEFNTPPFVFEKMFAQKQMYFFSDDELVKLNTAPTDEVTLTNFSKIDEFLVRAEEVTKRNPIVARKIKPFKQTPSIIRKEPSETEIIKMVKKELHRIGCGNGSVDGDGVLGWASKRALDNYNISSNASYILREFFTSLEIVKQLKKKPIRFCIKEKVREIDLGYGGYSFVSTCGSDVRKHTIWFRSPDSRGQDDKSIPDAVKYSFTIEDAGDGSLSKYGLKDSSYWYTGQAFGWAYATSRVNEFRFEIAPDDIKTRLGSVGFNGTYSFIKKNGVSISGNDRDGCKISGSKLP